MLLTSYFLANTSSTIELVKQLQSQNPKAKIVLIWDGASHHRSQEFGDFLAQTNQGKEWNVHCLRFARQRVAGGTPVVATAEVAPYAPEENPIENVWGQLKQMWRSEAMPLGLSLYFWCRSFLLTKRLFEMLVKHQLFALPDLNKYDAFSSII